MQTSRTNSAAVDFPGHSRLVAFRLAPVYHKSNETVVARTREDIESSIDRKLCVDHIKIGVLNFSLTWAPISQVSRSHYGVTDIIELPVTYKMSGLDMSPRPAGTMHSPYVFRVKIAPFCFQPADYWKQFAHEKRPGSLIDNNDYSPANYVNQVSDLVSSAGGTTDLENDGELRISFNKLPSMRLMQSIAALAQTYKIDRRDSMPGADNI